MNEHQTQFINQFTIRVVGTNLTRSRRFDIPELFPYGYTVLQYLSVFYELIYTSHAFFLKNNLTWLLEITVHIPISNS